MVKSEFYPEKPGAQRLLVFIPFHSESPTDFLQVFWNRPFTKAKNNCGKSLQRNNPCEKKKHESEY